VPESCTKVFFHFIESRSDRDLNRANRTHWELVCRDACYTTQPVELLNPDSAIFLGSDYGLGPRKFGTTPISSFRGEQLPMGKYATDAGRVVEFSANGSSPARTPGSVSNGDGASLNHRLSFDSIADDRLERSSIAESEGCHPSSTAIASCSECYASYLPLQMELIIVYLHMFISGTSFISLWNFLMSEKV
jgi:hypothetical protein